MAEAEFVRALDRGLAIIQAFSAETPVLTVSEAADATGLSRATARRFLYTLEQLDFVRATGRGYQLTAKTLSLGYAYLSSFGLGPIAQPRIDALAAEIREPVTVSTRSGLSGVCIARADADRILMAPVMVGTARPLHCSSLGKVLLAHLPDEQLDDFFARAELTRFTEHTISDERALRAELAGIRAKGWAVSDEEIEEGLVSVGAPIRRGGEVIAAINAQSHTARTTLAELIETVLPRVLETAEAIGTDLAYTAQ
ncbi:IclR family transcriptional regulator C-terminal domain-containing protein [Amycolatopsis ultiminotia]|uniref:IclR family transcriptional regulator C-terminal domain-containing protein n=1 Tax=Amycolatopsis ultiminotia TaxID=543629 RepID=A0ABP6W2X1_9PSEU